MEDNSQTYNTSEREEIESLAAAYALGVLDEQDPDFSKFEQLLEAGDPILAEALEAHIGTATLLSHLPPQVEPPAALKDQLLTKVASRKADPLSERLDKYQKDKSAITEDLQRTIRKKNRMLIGVSLISGLLLCTLIALNVQKAAKLDWAADTIDKMVKQRDSLSALALPPTTDGSPKVASTGNGLGIADALVAPVVTMFQEGSARKINLSTLTAPSNHRLFYSAKQNVVVLMKENLGASDAKHQYAVWQYVGATPQPLGAFTISAAAPYPMYAFATSGRPESFSVSLEPRGSLGARPQGPILFTGSLKK